MSAAQPLSLIYLINQRLSAVERELCPNFVGVPVSPTAPAQSELGHFQYNGAMKLSGHLKLSSREVAQKLLDRLLADDVDHLFEKISISGPGFINLSIHPQCLSGLLNQMRVAPLFGIELKAKRQRIIVDYSSPNVAKEMHVGHLRSTIIGDALARLFAFLGQDVLRLNHIGDYGTAFGMLIAYLKEYRPHAVSDIEQMSLTDLVAGYRAAKKLFDEDPEFKKAAQLAVVSLQAGEASDVQAWRMICKTSSHAYQEIYDLLGIAVGGKDGLIERGESFYRPWLAEVVVHLERVGLLTVSDDAACVFMEGMTNREGEPLPLIVRKSDGGYNYATTDLAAVFHRTQIEKADRIIYVTDAGQTQHLAMVFETAKRAGYLNQASGSSVELTHVPFGLVLGEDGKKFKTRSGETERLIDLLNEAVLRADHILKERQGDFSQEVRQATAKTLGINAVKYADLSCQRTADYRFSYERMLRFEGNTAAFIGYALVRILSIKRKINLVDFPNPKDAIVLTHPAELALGLHLNAFIHTLGVMTQELMPHRLTDYLYQLAVHFNNFFRDCRVEGAVEQRSRLLLCDLCEAILKQGMALLGLQSVDRM